LRRKRHRGRFEDFGISINMQKENPRCGGGGYW
jgi:hypothetical protein